MEEGVKVFMEDGPAPGVHQHVEGRPVCGV